MRYTTIIDLREWPKLYANANIRLVYFHLVLISGYHDQNRDLTHISIRQLAYEAGLTVSATRHALRQLEKVKLIKRQPGTTIVAKWLKEQPISKRQNKLSGAITDHVLTQSERSDKSSLQQLQELAAAGDKSAQEILNRHFKNK